MKPEEPVRDPKSPAVRVLVLDNDPAVRRLLEISLLRHDFETETASSGHEALRILMQRSFNVLVVDLRMHAMDGMSFLQEALKIWPWLGVVIVSGYVTPEVVAEAAELGVKRVLPKPVDLNVLCEYVREEAQVRPLRPADIPGDMALSFMRDHLSLLTRLGEEGIASQTLTKALIKFSADLAHMLPSTITGILVISGRERSLVIRAHDRVHRNFLSAVETEMLARYSALSTEPFDRDSVRFETHGPVSDTDGPTGMGSTVSVPLISDDEICGLLTLASAHENAYTPTSTSLLYHASNHISAMLIALRRLHAQMVRDPLSGVFNRLRLEEELDRAWNASRRYDYSMAVAVVDIDHFKSINDTHGHSVGDTVIREFARLMEGVTRASDIIARYGGDEFVAILPRAGSDSARSFARRLLETTRNRVFCEADHRLQLTVSIGVSTSVDPSPAAGSAALLSQADRALYMAKNAGRNRLSVWPGHMAGDQLPDDQDGTADCDVRSRAPSARGHVIVVDDEAPVLEVVGLMLSSLGYSVTTLDSAAEAIEKVRARPGHYDVVLTDLGLPGTGGIELVHELSSCDESIIKLVMTGNVTVRNAVGSLREGAYDFIEKPVDKDQLAAMMQRAFEYRRLRAENARYQAHLEEMVKRRSDQLAQTLREVRESYEFTLEAMVAMLDARERLTSKHSSRTRELTLILARELGYHDRDLDVIAQGALLHDIGKIGIPDAVLLKPGPLNDTEWESIHRHPDIGADILRFAPHMQDVARMLREHHERFDGKGYPRGLEGSNICTGARIFALADSYDAMCAKRVYRDAMTPEQAAAEILRGSGGQFDPEVVEAFKRCRKKLERCVRLQQDDPGSFE